MPNVLQSVVGLEDREAPWLTLYEDKLGFKYEPACIISRFMVVVHLLACFVVCMCVCMFISCFYMCTSITICLLSLVRDGGGLVVWWSGPSVFIKWTALMDPYSLFGNEVWKNNKDGNGTLYFEATIISQQYVQQAQIHIRISHIYTPATHILMYLYSIILLLNTCLCGLVCPCMCMYLCAVWRLIGVQ